MPHTRRYLWGYFGTTLYLACWAAVVVLGPEWTLTLSGGFLLGKLSRVGMG